MRIKQLTWVARIVKAEDYYAAKAQAAEVRKEKRKFEEQRHAIKVCAIRQSHLREDKSKLKDLGSELNRLEEELEQKNIENEKLKHSKAFSDRRIYDLEVENMELLEKISKLSSLVGESEAFIEQIEDEKVELNNTIAAYDLKCQSYERKIAKLKGKVKATEALLNASEDVVLNYKLCECEYDYDD